MLVFFNRGCTTACLKDDGTVPDASEPFIIDRILGPLKPKVSIRRRVGTISRGQVVGLILKTIHFNEAKETVDLLTELSQSLMVGKQGCWWMQLLLSGPAPEGTGLDGHLVVLPCQIKPRSDVKDPAEVVKLP